MSKKQEHFYIGTLLIVCAYVCARAGVCMCMYVYRIWLGGGGGGGAVGCKPLIIFLDVCQFCCLVMFLCLPLSTFLLVKRGE